MSLKQNDALSLASRTGASQTGASRPGASQTGYDRLLRFDGPILKAYEREHRPMRMMQVRQAVLVGLILYNLYNIESVLLQPDIAFYAWGIRILIVTPVSLMLAWSLNVMSPAGQERALTLAMFGVVAVPCFLFWWTQAPLGAYSFNEILLTLIFGNMLLGLRFAHAILFTLFTLAIASLAVWAKTGLGPALSDALLLQISTACLFSLYANWRTEADRVRSYVAKYQETLKSQAAEHDRRRFQDLSLTDALTGLPNRRALDLALAGFFKEKTPVAVMMIDVDHFKLFNDRLGHPAGDDCLRAIGAALARLVAENQGLTAARFGGEEFTLVATNITELDAARLAYRLIRAVSGLSIAHPARADGFGAVTISAGVALSNADPASSPAHLIATADEALYRAKKAGRNRYVLQERPRTEGAAG